MEQVVIGAENIALLDLLNEKRKASLVDAICATLRGQETPCLDEATSIVYNSILRDNENVCPITKSSTLLLSNNYKSQERIIKENAKKKRKERSTDSLRTDEAVLAAFEDFAKMRKKIKKPFTENAESRAWSRLEKLSEGDAELAVEILNQSVDHCWQDLYELEDTDEDIKGQKLDTKEEPLTMHRNQKIQNSFGFGTERDTDYNALVWQKIRERWAEEEKGDDNT